MRRMKVTAVAGSLAFCIVFVTMLAGCPGKKPENQGIGGDKTAASGQTKEDKATSAKQELDKAIELITTDDKENIKQGIAHAKKSLELQPDQPKPTCAIGSGYRKLGNIKEALTWYEKAIALKPDYVICYDNMGLAYWEMAEKETDEAKTGRAVSAAEKTFLKAIELDDQYADAHFNLAALYLRGNQLDKARSELDTYMELTTEETRTKDAVQLNKDIEKAMKK